MTADVEAVLAFWFEKLRPAQWFRKDPALDREIAQRFGALHAQAIACECFEWRAARRGRLAEIIVLDQFSRNIYRRDDRAFASDAQALVLAQEAVAKGVDQSLSVVERSFLYMPYMHSESLVIHHRAVQLFDQPGLERNLDAEKRHKAIIERFRRYPHRNAVLGRISSQAEVDFLNQPGSSF